MFTIECERMISSSHFLRCYEGKCASLHGHNWTIQARLWIEDVDSRGLSIDFGAVKDVIMRFDHKHLNDFAEFKGEKGENNPTAENLARVLWRDMRRKAKELGVKVERLSIDIWETPKNRIHYTEEIR